MEVTEDEDVVDGTNRLSNDVARADIFADVVSLVFPPFKPGAAAAAVALAAMA